MLLARQATLSPHQGLCFPIPNLALIPLGLLSCQWGL